MDKKKLGIRLKKETSATGTGASVTPGVGMGVATKYAFKKKVKEDAPQLAAGKVKDNYAVSHFGFTDAPSVPNRKSKAIDYKELWEAGTYESLAGILKQLGAEEDSIKVLIKAVEMGALKPTDAITVVKKTLSVKEELQEGFKSGKEFINIKLQKYPKALSKVNNLINMIGENNFTIDMAEWIWDFFNNASFESPISEESLQEGYAQFRNATKMRSKPDQFHQAVKEIKKKMNEINRIFEYVDRLKTELSEGEDLKYKKYTENAFQQIKESAKALFLKSTKLK